MADEPLVCNKCNRSQPDVEFHWRFLGPGVKHRVCSKCQAETSKQHYLSNKGMYAARVRQRRATAQAAINAFVGTRSCTDCGEQRPAALSLDPTTANEPATILAARGLSSTSDAWQNFSSTLSTQYVVRCLNCIACRRTDSSST